MYCVSILSPYGGVVTAALVVDTEPDPKYASFLAPESRSYLAAAAKNRQDRGKAGHSPPGFREGTQPQEPRMEVVG